MVDVKFLKNLVRKKALRRFPHKVKLGNQYIGDEMPVFIIAEIGVNHEGDVAVAKKLIDAAKKAGANAVKFQKRSIKEVYKEDVLENPEKQEWGIQYLLDVLKRVELSADDLRELKRYSEGQGLTFLTTPFDEPSVDLISSLGVHAFKTASADLTNFPLLEKIVANKKPVLISTGMSTLQEVDSTVEHLKKFMVPIVLLHCQSNYPANIDDLNLKLIPFYRKRYGVPIGYSGHERDIDTTLAAVAMGASVVERHITFDKNAAGPDHSASLEPEEFAEMVSKIRKFERARGVKARVLTAGEVMNRTALGKSLVAAMDIPKGTLISREMIIARSPAKGLSPQYLYHIVGRKLERDLTKNEFFLPEDLQENKEEFNVPKLSSKWGLKARFHDMDEYLKYNPKFLEFHLTAKDLDHPLKLNGKKYSQELYLHAPEYLGEQVVDLCSYDDKIWKSSIDLMQKTIDRAREWGKLFAGTPKIIIHVGGMSLDPVSEEEAKKLIFRAVDGFKKLNTKGVVLLPENLPALAWYFAGQWYQNAFVRADEIVTFCKELGLKMCLDTSHAWLAANYFGFDYYDFIDKCAPFTEHMHIADGAGVNGEGLQIAEGEIDFKKVFDILKKHNIKNFSWVPEIWRGHLYNGRGFIVALNRLKDIEPLK